MTALFVENRRPRFKKSVFFFFFFFVDAEDIVRYWVDSLQEDCVCVLGNSKPRVQRQHMSVVGRAAVQFSRQPQRHYCNAVVFLWPVNSRVALLHSVVDQF